MNATMLHGIGVMAVLAVVVPAGCHVGGDAFKAKYTRNEVLTAPLADIASLDISTNVGRIELRTGDVSEAQITAEIIVKAGTEEKAQELAAGVRIEAEASGRTLVIKAVKPSGFGRNPLVVNFTVTAPAALAVKAASNVGDLQIAGFTERVEARSDVGRITCTNLRSDANLHTNDGDVHIEYASDAPAAISVDASSNVGDVELAGPQDISAKITAETNVGSITSDRPLTIKGSLKKSIHATLGDGEGRIHLSTNVGAIHIR